MTDNRPDNITIDALPDATPAELRRLIDGYTATALYRVTHHATRERMAFTLERVPRDPPYVKSFAKDLHDGAIANYQVALADGYSFGAWDGTELVGLAIVGPNWWNATLWVWEFHVAATHRRRGIGRRLMAAVERRGREAGLRAIACETQNTNADAIDAYLRLGFHLAGIDLSFYTNADFPDGEIALFMKRLLT